MVLDRTGATRTAGGAALPTQLAAATTPYRAALAHRRLPLVDGEVRLPTGLRDAVVLVALRVALTDEQLTVRTRVGTTEIVPLTFATFSDVDTWLPLFGPADDVTGDTLAIDVQRVEGERALDADVPRATDRVADEDAAHLVEVVVVEGVLARVLLLAELEKQRLRREARAVAAGAEVRFATRSLLDLHGADLGVPRRRDGGLPETDARYRARLALFTERLVATPGALARLLDGLGGPGEPGAGLPSLVGVGSRFDVTEGTAAVDLGLALVMVADSGTQPARTTATEALARLHRGLDEQRFVPVGADVPASRVLPGAERARLDTLARLLGERLTTPAPAARAWLAPQTAQCLGLALRTLLALGARDRLDLLAAHTTERDPRFHLGLVVALRPLTAGVLRDVVTAASDEAVWRTPARDAGDDVVGVLSGAQPTDPTSDPLGAWLWRACGFRTVLDDGGELLLSPLPVGRIVVSGANVVAPTERASMTATFVSLRGTGRDARVDDALADLAAGCVRRGVPDLVPSALTASAAETALSARAAATSSGDLPTTLAATRLPWGAVSGPAAASLAGQVLGAELPETVVFALARTTLEAAGDLGALAAGWAAALGDVGLVSVRGLWEPAGDRMLLVATLTRVLGPGTGAARATSFRWRAASISRLVERSPVDLAGAPGPTAVLTAGVPGPALVVVAVPRRTGTAGPYQVAVTLPGGADGPHLDAEQYGYVMNLLEHVHPIGVEVSTYDLRRNHVDLDADGSPDVLASAASRTYLRYRRRRPADSTPHRHPHEQENHDG